MADQVINDLLVMFLDHEGKPIPGESFSDLGKSDSELQAGFKRGFMFEVDSFTLKTGLGGVDEEKLAKQAAQNSQRLDSQDQAIAAIATRTGTPIKPPKGGKLSNEGFSKFRTNTMKADTRYPVDMRPVEFVRSVDTTSSILLWHCIQRNVLKSASMIKRRAAGGPASGEVFLRLDFDMVLIKSVDWNDGEPVKETVEFVCRAVTVNYKPQLPDGSLGDAIQPAFWKSSDKSSLQARTF